MRKKIVRSLLLIIGVTIMGQSQAISQYKSRDDVPSRYTWNLADLYASDQAWEQAKKSFVKKMQEIDAYKGHLGDSPQTLLKALDTVFNLQKELVKLNSYASMKFDLDTRDAKAMGLKQEIELVSNQFSAKTSFLSPEILQIDPKKIDEFIAKEPGLKIYAFYLHDIQRMRPHTLNQAEEKIIADAGLMASAPYNVYGVLSNADMPFPTITLSTGEKVQLSQSAYTRYRASTIRQDRKLVFNKFWKTYDEYKRTLGTTLNAEVQKDLFYARVRKYNTCLEAALDENNIPTSVYYNLIKDVNENLGTLYRYLKIRKRMLGVDTLRYYDIYPPLVSKVKLTYPIDDAEKLVLQALKPLGNEYLNALKYGYNHRWVDVFPTPGKRSGAYSNGSVYDVHPFILLNYNGAYDDVSTLAHESGHTMQSYLSNKYQPYPTSQYPIFVAEVASTFNEALLMHHVLDETKDPNVRLSLLGNFLENIRGTVFRQTQFAEFELKIHEMVEKGESLTGDKLNQIYGKILKKYYGVDKGVMAINPLYYVEWAYIPHFYYNFYVYQYATSFVASQALVTKVLSGDKEAVQRYLTFLKSGGSEYPVKMLQDAGVDLTTSEPFDLTMKTMNQVMDEIEAILNQKK
ncbi:MAG: oligoendopeptidase F [Calditrichaeota bacterium]|nr:oligoendopeptidase F [Calditrichota bacterium]